MRLFLLAAVIFSAVFSAFAEEAEFVYTSNNKRDPFVPLVSKDGVPISDVYGIKSIKDVRLEGIVWDEASGSAAIINGEIVKAGDEIGGIKVLNIEQQAVIFRVNGEDIRIDFEQD